MNQAHILIVEDESAQRRLIRDILTGQGHEVMEATGLASATERLAEGDIDVVISDWKLEDGDGSQVLGLVREGYPETGFIMVTAYGSIAHAVSAIRSGADDYLAKPFERQALLMALERTCLLYTSDAADD